MDDDELMYIRVEVERVDTQRLAATLEEMYGFGAVAVDENVVMVSPEDVEDPVETVRREAEGWNRSGKCIITEITLDNFDQYI